MNNNQPIAVILGGTDSSSVVIENLKDRGYYALLIDYLDNPPAKSVADEHIQISTLEKETVLNVIRERNVSCVVNLLLDLPLVTAAYVAEKLKLPTCISYESALHITDKKLMKHRMFEFQIPTAKFHIIDDFNNPEIVDMKYPLVVKPFHGNGSLGIKKVHSLNELKMYLCENKKEEVNGGILVEECYKGIEIQVDCFIKDGIVHILMVRSKEKITIKEKYEWVLLGSLLPVHFSPQVKKKIVSIAQKIVKAFDLKNGPMHYQAFVDGDTVNVIEVAARIGGAVSARLLKKTIGLDFVDISLNALLGKEVNLHINAPKYTYATVCVYAKHCVYGKIVGIEELVRQKAIDVLTVFKTKGMIIPEGITARNKIAFLLVWARTHEELQNKIDYVFDNIDVLDMDGNSVMIKSLKKSAVNCWSK